MTPKRWAALTAVLLSFPLDLLTKQLVNRNLMFADRIEVIPGFFYLTHVRNTGAAFGWFSDHPSEFKLVFFIGVSLVAMGIIASFYRRLAPGEWLSALALGLILGGAAGNLFDRIVYREVIDFLHFKLWGGYAWPDFNLADSFIVVGVGILILELLATEGEKSATTEGSGEPNA